MIVKRFVTLIEMMIVMFLIALIAGVIAYNYQGALEKGKVFATERGIEQIENILNISLAENPDLDVENDWERIVREYPLTNNPDKLVRDGWGEPYDVRVEDGRITVTSRRLEEQKGER